MDSLLTGGLVARHGDGLHVVAERGHGDGVVAAGLELVQAEAGVRHHQAAAVTVEGLQLVVGHLANKVYTVSFSKDAFSQGAVN